MNGNYDRRVILVTGLVLLVLGIAVVPGVVLAQPANLTLNTVGERSALMAGAVVAAGGTADSVYYNPAGLAQGRHTTLSVSTSAFTYVSEEAPGGLTLVQSGDDVQEKLAGRVVGAYTPALCAARAIGGRDSRHRVGACLITPLSGKTAAAGAARMSNGSTSINVATDTDVSSLYGTLGYARGNDDFSVGISTSIKHVRAGTALQMTLVDREKGADTTRLMLAGTVDARMLGQEFTAGFSWRPKRWLRVGGRVVSPTFVYSREVSTTNSIVHSKEEQAPVFWEQQVQSGVYSSTDSSRATMQGWLSTVGAAVLISGRHRLEVDGEYYVPVQDGQRAVVNFRAGAEFEVGRRFLARAGVFTDYSPMEELPELAPENTNVPPRLDIYGATLGATWLGASESNKLGIKTISLGVRGSVGLGEMLGFVGDMEHTSSFNMVQPYRQYGITLLAGTTFNL